MPETCLPLAAIEAKNKNLLMRALINSLYPRRLLEMAYKGGNDADWICAGLNCTNDADILNICEHTFLMDWRPE